ncbi:JmjC domain-containing protein [Dinoroseobacter sp. S375]|uniref:JmjC domain-containing protein n=1 Tax=Dinoroseobacter sp. S375 TaxID=3415136 RepID=UPI003C7BA820
MPEDSRLILGHLAEALESWVDEISDSTVFCSQPALHRSSSSSERLVSELSPMELLSCNLSNSHCVRHNVGLGRRVSPERHLPPSQRLSMMLERFKSGWTIASDEVEHISKVVQKICFALSTKFDFICRANLYLTPPNGQGFPPHFDAHDVLVLHLSGEKVWMVDNFPHPVRQRHMSSPKDLELSNEPLEFQLNPGDTLFVPRGHAHVVKNLSGAPGCQLTFACSRIHVEDVIKQVIDIAVLQDDSRSQQVSSSWLSSEQGDAFIAGVLKELCNKMLEPDARRSAIDDIIRTHQSQFDEHSQATVDWLLKRE